MARNPRSHLHCAPYTVQSFLNAAGTSRRNDLPALFPGHQWDHIIELQLVVAAINNLSSTTYTRKGWQSDLADFFQRNFNFQQLPGSQNREKGQAVGRMIQGKRRPEDVKWIQSVRDCWIGARPVLISHGNYLTFIGAMNALLEVP